MVELVVTDGAGNKTEYEGTLVVSEEEAANMYLSCRMTNTSYEENIRLAMIDSSFIREATRNYIFTFSEAEYNAFKELNEGSSEVTYNNVTGRPTFNDTDHTVTISMDLSAEEMSEYPTAYGQLRSYFSNLGYVCALEVP